MTETEKRRTPNDDPRNDDGEGSASQTKKPWKQNPQNTTDPSQPDTPKPDLEKWQESNTH